MLKSITIENYKSIEKLALPLGRINVFIGENGAGKSNVLEAIALAGAAQALKLDNEFLASRGIRVTGPKLMRSAFSARSSNRPIKVSVQVDTGTGFDYELINDNKPYSTWECSTNLRPAGDLTPIAQWLRKYLSSATAAERKKFFNHLNATIDGRKMTLRVEAPKSLGPPNIDTGGIEDFIIYAPENSTLRTFERVGQIEPLGINGEGLLKLLHVMSSTKDKAAIKEIKNSLKLFGWFKDFKVARGKPDDHIEILDQFLNKANPSFDQRSANEGFLFIAFYLALFTSRLTPRFFAIDNVDSSLNPKLCTALMDRLSSLARTYDKQVLLTTHNAALLDGLNLSDPEQRLFVVSRGLTGQTRVRRFEKKPSNAKPRRLSDMFLSGALGGLPKGF